MASTEINEVDGRNQAAFRRMKGSLDERYLRGRFLAMTDDRVEADATNMEDLLDRLPSEGVNPQQTLVFQAGVEYPTEVTIFVGGLASRAP